MGESEDRMSPLAGRAKSEEIREEIDRTRMELEETVDAIGAKLRPGNLAQEGWQKVKSSTQSGASRVVRIAREHPIPLGLIGVGVTWLAIERARRNAREDWRAGDVDDYADVAAAGADYGSTEQEGLGLGDKARNTFASARESVEEAKEKLTGAASQASHKVSEAAGRAGRTVGRLAGRLRSRAADMGHRTGEQAQRAREGFWDLVERRPLAAGAATLAAGVLVGLMIPATRREDELMGETRDELFRGARETGREALEKTKEVARSAADAAQQAAESEVERQNLMPGKP